MKQFTLAAICLLFIAACNSHSHSHDDHNGHSHGPDEPHHGTHENHSVPKAPADTTQETFSLPADSTVQAQPTP